MIGVAQIPKIRNYKDAIPLSWILHRLVTSGLRLRDESLRVGAVGVPAPSVRVEHAFGVDTMPDQVHNAPHDGAHSEAQGTSRQWRSQTAMRERVGFATTTSSAFGARKVGLHVHA